MIPEVLAAVGGLGAAAVPAALVLRRMRAQLSAVRSECAAARYDATHDRLTGLRNRAGLDAALAERAASGGRWALIMLDLDGFKEVNDQYGHDAGDEVLYEASFRLAELCDEPGDVVGRLGGDEFLVAVDVAGPGSLTVGMRARMMRRALAQPIELESGSTVTVTASVGMVHAEPGADLARVRRSADVAVYRSKAHGGDQVAEYGMPGELAVAPAPRPAVRLRDRSTSDTLRTAVAR